MREPKGKQGGVIWSRRHSYIYSEQVTNYKNSTFTFYSFLDEVTL